MSLLKNRPSLPVVGIPACIKMLGAHPFHAVGAKYAEAVLSAAGCLPVIIPAFGDRLDLADLIQGLDGLLLTGSVSNVEPSRYGAEPAYPDLLLDKDRDATTFPLIDAALAQGVPLMGICRGFQELNVACGGTLFQEVHRQPGYRDHRVKDEDPVDVQYGPAHPVRLAEGGQLRQWLGGADSVMVNSIHGQGIHELGAGLVAEAYAEDGLVEAIRVAAAPAFAFAVQWHPEWKATENPTSQAIFSAFGRACRERAERRSNQQ